ncbi:MAG: hypothetical protein OHK0039_09540 [Bacteroidia bacterium]
MTRQIALSLLVLLAACAAPQPQTPPAREAAAADDHFDIRIAVKGVDTDTAYLAYYLGETQYLKDTTVRQGEYFVFQGDTALPVGMYLIVFPPANRYFDFIVSGDQTFTLRTDTTDFGGMMQVEGSEDNQVFYDHIQYLADKRREVEALNTQLEGLAENSPEAAALRQQLDDLNKTVMAERKHLRADRGDLLGVRILVGTDAPEVPEAPEGADQYFAYRYYKTHFFDQVSLSDEGLMRSPILSRKIDEYLERLTAQHPDSLIPAVDSLLAWSRPNQETFKYMLSSLLNRYAKKANEIMGMDGVYLHIVEKYYAAGQAWWLDPEQLEELIGKAEQLSPVIIGKPALDFSVPEANGRTTNLYSVKGDWIILYFWDYDCGRCKTVTPQLAKLYPRYKDRGVALFTVNINGSQAAWMKKLEEYGLTAAGGIHTSDPTRQSGFDEKYNINSTPKVFILDKDKIIRYKWIGVDQIAEILDRELSAMPGK